MKTYPTANDDLVEYLQKQGIVNTPAVLEAFRAVDRGDFATPNLRQVAYMNRPVQHGHIHLSAPFIYAEALEELRPKVGMSFLNIVSLGITNTSVREFFAHVAFPISRVCSCALASLALGFGFDIWLVCFVLVLAYRQLFSFL